MLAENKRNGHSPKTLKSQYGELQDDISKEWKEKFEPKLIPKYLGHISGIEEKVIVFYGRGMSTRDIHDQLHDLYGIEVSVELLIRYVLNQRNASLVRNPYTIVSLGVPSITYVFLLV